MAERVRRTALRGVSEPLGLADALFGRVRQRVLGLLFGHPERSYYANEIIGWVGSGSGSVQRELARLEASGLVTVTPRGRQKHFKANRGAPIFPELRGIVLKTSGLADVLRTALSACSTGQSVPSERAQGAQDLGQRRRG
jgi:hypothetical protein